MKILDPSRAEKIFIRKKLCHTKARRHVFKSGPAEVRASAEGTIGGEHERGCPLL